MQNEKIKEYFKKVEQSYPTSYIMFVKKYANTLINLTSMELKKSGKIERKEHTIKEFSEFKLNSSMSIAQTFFNNSNIIINLKDLYDKKELKFFKGDQSNRKSILDNPAPISVQGYSDHRGKYMEIFVNHNIMDAFIIVHEVTHYRNQPNRGRNYVSDMLTEAISYGTEYIFAQTMIEQNFMVEEVKLYLRNCLATLFEYAYKLNIVYVFTILYRDNNRIDYEDYKKAFRVDQYEQDVERFEQFMQYGKDHIVETWNFLGKSLAVYILSEYLKDKNFMKKGNELNYAINNKTFEECLEIINIYGPNDLLHKMSQAMDTIIDYIYKD